MSPIHKPVLSPGSRVLVTGVSGFLGSHVADQLLAGGYLVTGTTRDAAKNAWVQRLFDGKHGEGRFRLIEVPDITHQGAFDKLLDDITMNPDPNQVITPMVAGTLNLLNAAAKQPAVKRFVLTSSCTSAASQKPGVGLTIDEKTWNDDVTREAWAPPPYAAERGFAVYSASKMEMERESWKWHEEHKPHFVLNTGQTRLVKSLDFFVDVQDNARLHVAALIHPDVQGERIFAYASPFTWRGIQRIMQKLYPGKTFPRDLDEAELDKSDIVRAPRTEALLRDMGRPGWTSLEETVRLNIEDLA
ncbi:NAD(P)-binding protein [Canariomyces notabilis]|uniref:NAD(P)-binding protein n=1 Tax=Canariomyces notabilis TaxID=2074819 RepID=A0AAN6TEC4_9PEZI|nr:NAD(P)-binding protein [Canariomyces arenarius]